MDVYSAAAAASRDGRRACLAIVIGVGGSAPRSAGARMLVYADASIVGTIGGGEVERRVIERAAELASSPNPAPERFTAHLTRDLGMCCGGSMEVYIEPVQIREPFVVFGAGHVAHALAPFLVALDYDVTIVDERDDFAVEERFAGCRVVCADPEELAETLTDDPNAHWLVVTHSHQRDQALGRILLPRQFAWMGMIGSRSKLAKFFVRWRAAGLDERLFARLSAPVGLALGAETPAEIAVAIAAEVVRVRRRSKNPPVSLASIPIPARGGDGRGTPPALEG